MTTTDKPMDNRTDSLVYIETRIYQVRRNPIAQQTMLSDYVSIELRSLLLVGCHVNFYAMDMDHTIISLRGFDSTGRRFY